MRVVTTCHKEGLEVYGHRWLESRQNWPKDTDFRFYTEGFAVDCPGMDFRDLPEFTHWKEKHKNYQPPGWQWDVVKYAHKVFAACHALEDYDGIGVWLDADCVTYHPIDAGLIERQLDGGEYLACYQRTGSYTETGLWIMDCSHPQHREFMTIWRDWYFSEKYQLMPQWHDCFTLDATIKVTGVPTFNLSGEFHKDPHPQAKSELGAYIDHCKGARKIKGASPENTQR